MAVLIPFHCPQVVDRTRLADKQRRERNLWEITGITVHRLGWSVGRSAEQVSGAFQNTEEHAAGSYTGGEIPYTFLINNDSIEQLLEMGEIGPHARRWSSPTMGIACRGDFRQQKPGLNQWALARDLCAMLSVFIGKDAKLRGHTELPGGSSDPYKQCPGQGWDMEKFRADVGFLVASVDWRDKVAASWEAEKRLLAAGVVF